MLPFSVPRVTEIFFTRALELVEHVRLKPPTRSSRSPFLRNYPVPLRRSFKWNEISDKIYVFFSSQINYKEEIFENLLKFIKDSEIILQGKRKNKQCYK